jgi:lipoprotein-anchoring transpeptidase ErfK/SrfK
LLFSDIICSFILLLTSRRTYETIFCFVGYRYFNDSIHQAVAVKKKSHTVQQVKTKSAEVKSVNWNLPSGGPYPTITPNEPIWLDVFVSNQKVYVKDGDKTIYTMIASTGLDTKPDNSTPAWHLSYSSRAWQMVFYAPQYQEGAEYWVSWKNHGEFLFHSVPMDQNKHVLVSDAEKLGQKDSHGCVHLTIPDAKWIYDNIKTGTKVVIRS